MHPLTHESATKHAGVDRPQVPLLPATEATELFETLESNVRLYCRTFPAVFDRAKGSRLYAEDGREFIDFFCGAGALNYGHNTEATKRALLAYLERDGLLHGLDFFTTAKRSFLEKFNSTILAPRALDYRIQFCGPTGTNAVEAALKLARRSTGRTTLVAFCGGYHGMSRGALAVTGSRYARAASGTPSSDAVIFLPYESGPNQQFDSITLLEQLLDDPSSGVEAPAAVIVEPVQIEGGVYIASTSWLQRLRTLTQRWGALLICDEIQTGCGRTGDFFAFERAAIQPDIVTVSKSIGTGLPLALVLIRPDLDLWAPGEHTGTFRGNQLAFVAGTAALDCWSDPEFLRSRDRSIAQLQTFGQDISADHGTVTRGKGMLLGIDVGTSARAGSIQRLAFGRGVLVELCGRHDEVLKIMPAINIPESDLREGLEVLRGAIRDVRCYDDLA